MKHMWSEEELQTLIEEQGGSAGSGGSTLDDIVDSKGNKRFIEGSGTPITQEKWNSSYCKWSLSGTHLMCVFAGSVQNNASLVNNQVLAEFPLPEYILNKIFPVFGGNYLDKRSFSFFKSTGAITYQTLFVEKTQTGIRIINKETDQYNFIADYYFRLQIDLLIDTE